MIKTAVALLALLVSLGGCATLVPEDAVRPAAASAPVFLPTGFSYVAQSGLNSGLRITLKPGIYMPVLEGVEGVFYRGPEESISGFKNGEFLFTYQGGLWLPNAGHALRPRIFAYDGTLKLPGQEKKPASAGGAASMAATIATQNTPPGMSPLGAGLAGGISAAVLGALVSIDTSRVLFVSVPIPTDAGLERVLQYAK